MISDILSKGAVTFIASEHSRICLLYFHTWCGLGVNLECRSEMCCRRLA